MPAKVYVDAPPDGDFRAMPARGDGIGDAQVGDLVPRATRRAGCRWSPGRCSSPAPRPASCSRSSTAPRSPRCAPAPPPQSPRRRSPRADAATVGLIGCGVNGAWAARCLAAAGYGPGVCFDPRAEAAEALAVELGWSAGARDEAAAQDVVVTVTPAATPVIEAADLRPGQHLAVLGADAAGKAEVELAALERCSLFCDEWVQASKGGELSGAVAAGTVDRARVTEIGDVLLGRAPGSPLAGRDHPVRLHRARDAGPRDRAGGARIGERRTTRRRSTSEAGGFREPPGQRLAEVGRAGDRVPAQVLRRVGHRVVVLERLVAVERGQAGVGMPIRLGISESVLVVARMPRRIGIRSSPRPGRKVAQAAVKVVLDHERAFALEQRQLRRADRVEVDDRRRSRSSGRRWRSANP